ncbi:2-hydroxyacid dehydrogenase [Paenibacillus sp. NPDC056579]|uniref:2-hydroxyacid dehydrogenase n=1 Tax=Paenibacillus sp. NPDC056579 TaxID=3345871 RepID=UPI00367B66AA
MRKGGTIIVVKPICAVDHNIHLSPGEHARLQDCFDVIYVDFSQPLSAHIKQSELLLIHTRLNHQLIREFPKCKYIGIRAHNTDYIDRRAAEELGITITGIPQAGEHSVAEHTFALIFVLSKRILQSHNNVIGGRWRDGLQPNLELYGKKLGIIGYGNIGQRVAAIGKALGMTILLAAKEGTDADGMIPLEDVLKEADIVTIHASTRAANTPLLNRERIAMMKHGSMLINTARGKLVDHTALEEALECGRLFGAALDVFEVEPAVNERICLRSDVICTPHHAYYTTETLFVMNSHLIDNAIHYYLR